VPRVLIIDDEEPLLRNLSTYLRTSVPEIEVFTATSAEDGLALLERQVCDVLLTDVYLPGMDGIDLIPQALQRRPALQIMVMTAFDSPDLRQTALRRGALRFLPKPLDLGELKARILEASAPTRGWLGVVGDLDLFDLTQLLALSGRSKAVRVANGDRTGVLIFRDGGLRHASTARKRGPDAFFEMAEWPCANFQDLPELEVADHRDNVDLTTAHLMMEAARLQDEEAQRQRIAGEATKKPEPAAAARAPRSRKSGAAPRRSSAGIDRRKELATMSLDNFLNEFKSIKGYVASGVMDYTGELLAAHSTSDKVALEATGAVFNDIFRGAHEAAGKIGFKVCQKMVLTTPNGLIVMECSGVESAAHLHFIVILEEGGNQALVKVTLDKIVPQVVKAMS
jgi:CheY-like chemotaxis protein/predicted regulator of Ras-like GTPase activity (Roadblock/LC7/MglB family)